MRDVAWSVVKVALAVGAPVALAVWGACRLVDALAAI